MQKTGLYVHVPFCRSRCAYCDFYSTAGQEQQATAFVAAAVNEMRARRGELQGEVATIYVGGGTPSVLPAEALSTLLEGARTVFPIAHDAEVTVEVNPDDVCSALVGTLLNAGVNRVSMGVQTFDDALLRFLRRRHTGEAAVEAIGCLQREGITNISADLIYGLPGQTAEAFRSDVRRLCALPVTHLSAYALSYEEGTTLSLWLRQGKVKEQSDEQLLEMYNLLMDEAKAAGFEHYEISNFARAGRHSRHNSSYWQGIPYIGIGPGAHSYDGNRVRRANRPDLAAYIAAAGNPSYDEELLTPTTLYNEKLMTRLRTSEGLPLRLFTAEEQAFLQQMATPHIAAGTLSLADNRLRLTRKGLFVSDGVMSDLMKVD